jgi:hypothetical protein
MAPAPSGELPWATDTPCALPLSGEPAAASIRQRLALLTPRAIDRTLWDTHDDELDTGGMTAHGAFRSGVGRRRC